MSCAGKTLENDDDPEAALSFPSGSSYYNALQFSSGFFFSDVLDQSHFSGYAIECRCIKLPLAIILIWTDRGPIKIAYYFRYGDDVA
jgi:hypothetical protein